MRPILILLLITLVTGNNIEKEKIDIVLCILKNEKVREEVIKIIKSFETKDITKIIKTIFSSYPSIKEDVMNCVNKKPIPIPETDCIKPKLHESCRSKCKGMLHLLCKKDCYNTWCL